MLLTRSCYTLLISGVFLCFLNAQPPAFSFSPSIASGAFVGQIQYEGSTPENGCWIAAFDPEGNCAGANELIEYEGAYYANLRIYGDDSNTAEIDEGLLLGEYFSLKLFIPSFNAILDYEEEGELINFYGWTNNNGAPIPGFDDATVIYNFIPALLAYSFTTESPSCFDSQNGEIALAVSGGIPPYSFGWNTDQNNNPIQDLGEGIFSCTITDIAGHSLTTETIPLVAPAPIELVVDMVIDSCSTGKGALSTSVTGGTAPYNYLWSNEDTTASILELDMGAYMLTLTDNNGCEKTIMETVLSSPSFSVAAEVIDVSCFNDSDGFAGLSVSGSSPPYQYLWSNGIEIEINENLPTGNYNYTITDSFACQSMGEVIINQPDSISINIETTPEVQGESGGVATAIPSGGVPPYSFLWDDPDQQQSMTATNLSAGNYSVTVTDANNCTQTIVVLIDLITGIEMLEKEGQLIRVYPNPVNDFVVVDNIPNNWRNGKIMILDAIGTTKWWQSISNKEKLLIPISTYPKGEYFICFLVEGTMKITFPLIK